MNETSSYSKYKVDTSEKGKQKRTCNGILFDSELECRYYKEVVLVGLENGTIKKCDLQVKYELQPKFEKSGKKYQAINYVADFVITYPNGSVVVIDTKGMADATAKLKKKLMDYKYPDLNYIWVGYCKKYGGWLEYSQLEKLRKENKKSNNK